MEIFKLATDWAKAEVFSSKFFILFGLFFILAFLGFKQLGKSEIAKAYITPTLVAGILLLIIGIGLVYTNTARVKAFTKDNNTTVFLNTEISRAEKSIAEYKLIVFKVIPVIIVVCALLIVFIDKPNWRAICITTIAMMIVILLIDSNAHSRINTYHKQLLWVKNQNI